MTKNDFVKLFGVYILKYPLKDTLKWMFKDLSMRKRLLVTICAIIVIQLMSFIPLPCIDLLALLEFIKRLPGVRYYSNSLLHKIQIFSGFSNAKIFGLGLMPFISSCLLLQIATVFVPRLRKYSFGGESGREKIVKLTYVFTIIQTVIQAYFIALWLETPNMFNGMTIVPNPGFGFRLMTVTTITASVLLLLFIADIINRYGIGNGVAVIVVSSFFTKFIFAVNMSVEEVQSGRMQSYLPILLIIAFVGLACAMFYVTNRARVVEIQDNGSNKISLNFRSSMVGQGPLDWASSLIWILSAAVSSTHIAWLQQSVALVNDNYIVNIVVSAVLILVFSFLYALIVFDPVYVVNMMKKYGYTPVTNKNKSESGFLDDHVTKVLLITASVLTVSSLIPGFVCNLTGIPYFIASFIGGIAILMTVGIFSDIISQAEFFRDKADSEIKNWTVCYTAFDEFEAKIKSEYLKNKGIRSLVEPFRFTWGVPVRTMLDQYRIYVSSDKKFEARNLIYS